MRVLIMLLLGLYLWAIGWYLHDCGRELAAFLYAFSGFATMIASAFLDADDDLFGL